MKWLIPLLILTGCATTDQPTTTEVMDEPATGKTVSVDSANTTVSLFDEAHKCKGVVRYQIEQQDGKTRSRLSCEWTVQPDEWGEW